MTEANRGVPWLGWALVLVLALSFRLSATPTDYYADECVYIQHAWNLSQGQLELADDSQYIHRIPVYAAAALAYAVAGLNHAATIAWPISLSLLQILLLMAVAHRSSGREIGLLSGLLLAILPLDVIESTHLMPDVVMGSLMSIAALLWWLSTCRGRRRHRYTLLFLCGASLGLAVLARPYALVLGATLVLGQLVLRRRLSELVLVAIGGGIVLVAYLVTYQLAVGDALYRLEVVSQVYSSGKLAEPTRFLLYPKLAAKPMGPLGAHGLALLATIATVLVRPPRPALLLFIWILPIALLLQFGSMSLETYLPILKRARFLTPLSAPLCFLLALCLLRGVGRLGQRMPALGRGPALGLVVAVLMGTSALQVHRVSTEREGRYRAYQAAAQEIERHPELPLMVDHWRTAIRLGPHVAYFGGEGFYFGAQDDRRMGPGGSDGAGRMSYVGPSTGVESLRPGLLLLDRRNERNEAPLEFGGGREGALPRQLELLLSQEGVELYRLRQGQG